MATKKKETPKKVKDAPILFTKKQIVTSEKYKSYVDYLSGVLDDTQQYSLSEIDSMINKFMKGKVK